MYSNKKFIIAFSLVASLASVFITFGRKQMFKKYDVETQKVVVTSANISLPQSNRLDEMFALPAVIANDRDAGKDDSSAQSSDTPSLTPGVILE